jgi:hypothetical protein
MLHRRWSTIEFQFIDKVADEIEAMRLNRAQQCPKGGKREDAE